MSRKKKRQPKGKNSGQAGKTGKAWLDREGLHRLLPGKRPTAEELEQMSKVYQEKIRHSPLWDQLVKEYGEQKAEELLKEFRVELR